MEGGQASHAALMNEQEQAEGGTLDILQQIALTLQRAVQPATITTQRLAIERMARYRSVDFLGKKYGGPSMEENWLKRTE